MSYYENIQEESLKIRVAQEWFADYQYDIKGNIDFEIKKKPSGSERELFDFPLLWAEAKQGTKADIIESFVQLILTIGRKNGTNRIIDNDFSPMYIGAFDAEKIAFIPLEVIEYIFDKNDFDWTVTPSNHESKEFKELQAILEDTLSKSKLQFYYAKEGKELRLFIKNVFYHKNVNFKQKITDRNFARVFHQWEKQVLPSIEINWSKANGILPRDFYLADLLSENGNGLVDNLLVVLKSDKYTRKLKGETFGLVEDPEIHYNFNDNQKAYSSFWNRYARPPKKDFWNTIMERVDLLVPSNIRERKGAFFTPQIWVEKSQEYLAAALGENWQDDYYIWDCCAGTGNLEVGLKRPLRIWRSTLDEADVAIMRKLCRESERYVEEHIFQFDFLNGDFNDLPDSLKKVLDNEEKCSHLVIYINPPYAEATTAHTVAGTGKNKSGVAKNKTFEKAKGTIGGKAANELYIQFLFRIHLNIPQCIIAHFSTLKLFQSTGSQRFRKFFQSKLLNAFVVPASTFDNVKGDFPIGFFIWNTKDTTDILFADIKVFNQKGVLIGYKHIVSSSFSNSINQWIRTFDTDKDFKNEIVSYMENPTPDFQNNKFLNINNVIGTRHNNYFAVSYKNLFCGCVYFAVRLCIKNDWLNDRDQYHRPKDEWKKDYAFKINCLIYTLFHGQNRISVKNGINHWIPFPEEELNVVSEYESHFMIDFLNNNLNRHTLFHQMDIFDADMVAEQHESYNAAICLPEEAQAVYNAGKQLYKYYHSMKDSNPNASLYDIKEYFKGRNEKGKMNNTSQNEQFNKLMDILNEKMKVLEARIAPKIYEYGFLADQFIPIDDIRE